MAMVGNDRSDAIFTAVSSANPDFSKLSLAEKDAMKASFRTVFGTDTTYIAAHAEADPGTLATTASTLTAPPGGGPCTGTGTITGKGTIS